MAGRPKPQQLPFYTTVTPVKETFTDAAGAPASYDLPLVTLPAGTVLFRGVRIPEANEDVRYFYRDFLGNPEADGKVCLPPTHNVFFYPLPHVAFGTHTIGQTFNMMEVCVLINPVNIVCASSPSSWVRGQGQRYSGTAPWQRCGSFTGPEFDCHPATARELEAKSYDNCLLPEYQVRSGTRGWMAIADLDSINPKKKRWNTDKPAPMKDSTMGSYIRRLHSHEPEEAIDLLVKSYRDDHLHAGYPEIALYPYKKHPGRKLITRNCSSDDEAIHILEQEAKADNLNYLPLALITKDGVVDMVNGFFSFPRLGVRRGENYTAQTSQPLIETATREYMERLKTSGLKLPFYGEGKLSFDSRTGFFILPQIVPKNLRIKIPEAILYKNLNAAVPGDAERKAYEKESYRNFIMPLATEDDTRRVRTYELLFRAFFPEHFLERYGLEKEFGVRRAFVFEHFPYLENLFKELEIPMPKEFAGILGRAGALYRKEAGKIKKPKKPAPVAPTNSKGSAAAAAVAANQKTPTTPMYQPATPEFGGQEAAAAQVPPPLARTPPPPPLARNPNQQGGKTRSSRSTSKRQTRRRRTHRAKSPTTLAALFSRVWAAHTKAKEMS